MPLTGPPSHIDLSISDPVAAIPFYAAFFEALGYRRLQVDQPDFQGEQPRRACWFTHYAGGGFFGVEVRPSRGPDALRPNDRYAPGTHHIAFHADSPGTVDAVHARVEAAGGRVLDPPADYSGQVGYSEGYYAAFFADPDGSKLEVVYEPLSNPSRPASGIEADPDTPRMYGDLAEWWPLVSSPDEYAEEAGVYTAYLQQACDPETVLELGSGGGNNASHMKAHFAMTLSDCSPGMLAVSQSLNPECEHVLGDMCDIRLDREFGAVFIHDAITYLTTESDVLRAMKTAWLHTRPGGFALFVPDDTAESYRGDTDWGGHDGDGRALRYLEWSHPADPGAGLAVTDYVFTLIEGDDVRIIHDRHVEGLFSRETWLRLCREAGFEPEVRSHMLEDLDEPQEVFLCRKPDGRDRPL